MRRINGRKVNASNSNLKKYQRMLNMLKKTYFVKGLFQVWLRMMPRGNGVTEEDEILHGARGIDLNHAANTSKSGILFLIVANIT